MSNLYLPYIIIEIFCVVYACNILYQLNESVGTERQIQALKRIIITYLIVLAWDLLWALTMGGFITAPFPLLAVAQGGVDISLAVGCCLWCKYVEARLAPAYTRNRRLVRIMGIPLAASIVLGVLSIFNGWVFTVGADGQFQSGPLYNIWLLGSIFYLLVPTIVSLRRAASTRFRDDRVECLVYSVYMIPPVIGGVVAMLIPTVPFQAMCIFMVIQLLFLTIQDNQIYNDALTGLNNRRRLNQYLEERLSGASPERPVTLFMLDIDSFKKINDTFGHVAGDEALKLLAGVLKGTADRFGVFAARYGGDEFCLVSVVALFPPEVIEDDLRAALAQAQKPGDSGPRPFILTVSVGHLVCEAPEEEAEAAIRRADRSLYADKERRRYGRL